MRPIIPRARGFTLIELVIVMVIIGIMAAALAPLMLSSVTAYDTIQDNVAVLDKQRYAIERLAREIREVKYIDSTSGYSFGAMGPNSMTFTRTFHEFSGTPDVTVTVGNTATAVTLAYSSGGGTQVLTDELGSTGNLAFSYFQQDGTTAATGNTDVRHVQISLTLRHNNNDYPQRTQVELKNR